MNPQLTDSSLRQRLVRARRAAVRGVCRLAGCDDSAQVPENETRESLPLLQIGKAPATTTSVTTAIASELTSRATPPGPTGEPVVVAESLTKVYEGDIVGAQDVSINALHGEIVAIVGPNGAGKSTTLNMLSGLLYPTSGTASIDGVPTTDTKRLGMVLGVGLQTSGLDAAMTAREHFEVQAALYRMQRDTATKRAVNLVQLFGLVPYVDRQVAQFSVGLQRRLSVALAMLHDPQVIILDEPTAGLDPQSRRVVWELLESLRAKGRTIIFSTQLLEEADLLAQRLYVISDGRVIAEGSPSELRDAYGRLTIKLRVSGSLDEVADLLAGKCPDLDTGRQDGDQLVYDTKDARSDTARITAALEESGTEFLELSVGRPSLEDAFVRLTGSEMRPEPLLNGDCGTGGALCRCS